MPTVKIITFIIYYNAGWQGTSADASILPMLRADCAQAAICRTLDHDANLHYMTVTDRSVWLLNQFNVKMNEVEYLALRLTDGMYEEANKPYLVSFNPDSRLRSNLPVSYTHLRAHET